MSTSAKGSIVPGKLFGEYDSPGWTANGTGPQGVQPDPFDAEGMLFFKGWFSLVMGIACHVGGPSTSKRWDDPSNPWHMTGVDDVQFPYTFTKVTSRLAELFNANGGKGLH